MTTPADCLQPYECLPRCEWVGVAREDAGAVIEVVAAGQCLRFWAPAVSLSKGLLRGDFVSVLSTPTGLDVRRRSKA